MLKKEKLVKRICCLMMAAAMLFGCVYVSADETDTGGETAVKSGSCGKTESDSVTWNLSDDGILTISGTGAMADYDLENASSPVNPTPWYQYKTDITEIVVEEGITEIGNACFARLDKVTKLTLPQESLKKIGYRGCRDLRFTSKLTLPASLESVGNRAFENCKGFSNLQLGANATYGEYAFNACSKLTNIDIPKGVKKLSNFMFSDCAYLKNVYFSNTVEEIGTAAFNNCLSLEYIILPESVNKVGTNAFHSCQNLQAVSFANDTVSVGGTIFNAKTGTKFPDAKIRIYGGNNSTVKTYIDAYSENDKSSSPYVKGFEFINGYLCGPAVYYTYNDDKTEVEISVDENSNLDKTMNTFVWNTSFKESPLKGKTDLKEIKINDGVTNISNLAFEGCTNVELLTVPSTVEKIGGSIFANNKKLKYVLIPTGTAVIDNGAFNGCPNSMKVYGYKDSTAQTYAESKGFPFSEIDGNTMIIPEIANGKLSVYAKDAAENANIILKNSDSTSIVPKTVNLRVGLNTIKADDLNISAYADGKCYLWDSISGMHPKCAATTLK